MFRRVNAVLASQLGAPTRNDLIGLSIPLGLSELAFSQGALWDLRNQRRIEGELAGRTPWGRTVRLRVVSARVDLAGAPSYVLVSLDASEQRRLEAELRRAAARNGAILDATVDGIATIDASGRLVSVNRGLERLFGYSRDELLGRNVKLLMPEPYHGEHDQYLKRYRDTEVPHIIGVGREVHGLRKNGEVFPLRLAVGEIRDEEEPLFVGILSDLSEQASAEREAAELWGVLEDSLNEIYVFDADTLRFRTVNRGARDNVGYTMEELRARTPVDLKPEFDEAGFRKLIAPLRDKTLPRLEFQTLHRRRDGSEYRVEVHLQYHEDSNEYVAIILDVTEREALEQQLLQAQRMEAVGQLAGGIAHDFNNLLTSIQGSCELVASRMGSEDRSRPALDRIRSAAERGAALTRHLLAFGRRQVSRPEWLDLNNAIEAIGELTQRLVGDDVEFVLELSGDLPRVQADPTQLDQVLMNLIVNAGDAMPGGGELRVTTEVEEIDRERASKLEVAAGPAVRIAVSDTGTGIPPDVLAHIFEPFFTTKEVGKGTGLGLSTVFGIAKQCGWGIEVESREGAGTTFGVWLPVEADSAGAERPASSSESALSPTPAHVLLVEDDDLVRDHARETLEEAGYRVTAAARPEEALEWRGEVDVLLSDVVMPGLTGLELARRLRGRRPGLPVVLMSGYAEATLAGRDALTGEFPVLAKPFSNEALLAALARAVRDPHRRGATEPS